MEKRTEAGRQKKREYVNRYNAEAYDKITVRIPAGRKQVYTEAAKNMGKSLNGMIVEAVEQFIGGGK